MAKIRILLVDDHMLFRQGLRTLISAESDMEVAGEASNGGEAVEKADEVRPDMVLMDVSMPGLSSFEAARQIRKIRSDWQKPASWTVTYELLTVSDKIFTSMLAAKFIGYHTTRRQVRDFIKIHQRRNLRRIDSKTQRVNNRMSLENRDCIFKEDCLEGMKRIEDGSVDMIAADLPYSVTENTWDSIIPLELLWQQYRRIIKPEGVIVLTAQIPFSITLGASNLAWLKYEWIWEKPNATGFLNSKITPLRSHENVLVFAKGKHTYNPQMEPGKAYVQRRNPSTSTNWKDCCSDTIITINEGYRYPKTVLRFATTTTSTSTQHKNQWRSSSTLSAATPTPVNLY